MVAYIEENECCPVEDCREKVLKESEEMKWYRAILQTLFGSDETDEEESDEDDDEKFRHFVDDFTNNPNQQLQNYHVTVGTLQGDEKELEYNRETTVLDFKYTVQKEFGPEPSKQKLLFNDKELKVIIHVYRCVNPYLVQMNIFKLEFCQG